MNSQEAYKLLELDQSSNPTKDDVQAAFRKMAKKYHPDKNKDDPTAEAKFKEINSAYQLLTNPRPQQNNQESHNWQDIFAQHFGGRPNISNYHPVNIPVTVTSVTIDFAESVLGCTKEVIIDKHAHCSDCQGTGSFVLTDNCKHCKGAGSKQSNFTRGNVFFLQPCEHCKGTGKDLKKCDTCSGKGFFTKNGPVSLNLPGGLQNGMVLRTHEMMLQVTVLSDPDMVLREGDVVTTLELSLLDALKGTKKTVRTIKGEMNLKIPPKVKNKDNIVVQGYGVPNANGSHIFDIKVNYPENVDKIIEMLEVNA